MFKTGEIARDFVVLDKVTIKALKFYWFYFRAVSLSKNDE